MSSLAGEYFKITGEVCGLDVPPLLSGNPIQLGDPAVRIPLQMIDDPRTAPRTERIAADNRTAFISAADFLTAVAKYLYPAAWSVEGDPLTILKAAARACTMITPKEYVAGRLTDFRSEAVLNEELNPVIRKKLAALQHSRVRGGLATSAVLEGSAYIVTSAQLYAGKNLGRVACVTDMSIRGRLADGHPTVIFTPPSVTTHTLHTNELLLISGLWESVATARILEGDKSAHTLQGGLPTQGRHGGGAGKGSV